MRYLDSIRSMLVTAATTGVALTALAFQPGCQEENAPHAGRSIPGPAEGRVVHAPEKPLPEPGRDEVPPPPFVDVPIINQHLPEEQEFLRAYNGVHRPRIAVFVNRTLEGELVPATDGRPQTERTDHVVARGPGYSYDHTDTYLRPGEYDEAWAKNIDYAAIETALTDWLSADHQVTIVSPAAVRARLSDAEIARLQQGRTRELGELAKDLDADILVQVQARPTRQTPRGTSGVGIRLIAEAINVEHGESIARAQTTLPPPLDGPIINDYTRFLARKLMGDMIATWTSPGPVSTAPPPAGTPSGEAPPRSEVPQAPAPGAAPPPSAPLTPATPAESTASPASPAPPAAPATSGTDIPAPPPSAPLAPSAPSAPRTLNPYDLPEVKPAPAGTASTSDRPASDAHLAPAPPAPSGELVAPAPTTAPAIVLPEVAPTTAPAPEPSSDKAAEKSADKPAEQADKADKAEKGQNEKPEKPSDPFINGK